MVGWLFLLRHIANLFFSSFSLRSFSLLRLSSFFFLLNFTGAFAESKQIMMVMYQIGFMSTIMLLLYYFLNTSAASKVLIQSVVVLCVSLLSAILLFGTRIFQLYTTGDIDLQEIVRQQTMMTSQTHMQHTYNGSSDRETELEDEIAELKKKLKSAAIHPMNLQNQDIEIGGSSNGGA